MGVLIMKAFFLKKFAYARMSAFINYGQVKS